MDATTLQQVPEEYKQIYIRNWNTIKPSIRQGVIKDLYHYPLFSDNNDEIKSRLRETVVKYTRKIKINVAFGFILRNRRTDELRFFHPSNNTMVFDTPKLLVNINDRKKLEGDIDREDLFEYARLQRPSTSWIVEKLICIRFDIFRLSI